MLGRESLGDAGPESIRDALSLNWAITTPRWKIVKNIFLLPQAQNKPAHAFGSRKRQSMISVVQAAGLKAQPSSTELKKIKIWSCAPLLFTHYLLLI